MTAWDDDELDSLDRSDASDGLPPFATLVASLGDVQPAEDDDPQAEALARIVDVERITVSLAIEMAVEREGTDSLRVRGSTPTQWTETSVMPVFHKLTMHIEHIERIEHTEQATDGEE